VEIVKEHLATCIKSYLYVGMSEPLNGEYTMVKGIVTCTEKVFIIKLGTFSLEFCCNVKIHGPMYNTHPNFKLVSISA